MTWWPKCLAVDAGCRLGPQLGSQSEHLHAAWASSQHGGLREVVLPARRLRAPKAGISAHSRKAAWSFRTELQKSHGIT